MEYIDNAHIEMKILRRSDKDKITFKTIEKHRYGLWETVSKYLKRMNKGYFCFKLKPVVRMVRVSVKY